MITIPNIYDIRARRINPSYRETGVFFELDESKTGPAAYDEFLKLSEEGLLEIPSPLMPYPIKKDISKERNADPSNIIYPILFKEDINRIIQVLYKNRYYDLCILCTLTMKYYLPLEKVLFITVGDYVNRVMPSLTDVQLSLKKTIADDKRLHEDSLLNNISFDVTEECLIKELCYEEGKLKSYNKPLFSLKKEQYRNRLRQVLLDINDYGSPTYLSFNLIKKTTIFHRFIDTGTFPRFLTSIKRLSEYFGLDVTEVDMVRKYYSAPDLSKQRMSLESNIMLFSDLTSKLLNKFSGDAKSITEELIKNNKDIQVNSCLNNCISKLQKLFDAINT